LGTIVELEHTSENKSIMDFEIGKFSVPDVDYKG
jgi:hypothetical protein